MHKVKQMITKMILLDTILDKGLSINDVIIVGGYPDPPRVMTLFMNSP